MTTLPDELTLAGIRSRMGTGELTAAALTEHYLSRIERLNAQLHALLEINPDAAKTAASLDAEYSNTGPRGPLHGVPVLLKDNIDTADRMTTTAGSLALVGSLASADALVTQRLRSAGAVILGKTNLSEWANFRSSRSSSGWSSRGGQCRNPYALDRSPGGSSSGSGAAVAANLCAAAIGTETDGSIISPAAQNGIVGIKPTVGLIGRSGIIPISHSQDTAGPMARTVADAATILGALSGADPGDPATKSSHTETRADYTPFLNANGLDGVRIGVARELFGISEKADAVIEDALHVIAGAGAVLIDPVSIDTLEQLRAPEFQVMLFEFKAGINAYLKGLGDSARVKSLDDLIDFNHRNRDRTMPWFDQDRLLQAAAKGSLDDPAYRKALAECQRLSRDLGIDATLSKHGLDAIVAPSNAPAWMIDPINGDRKAWGSVSAPAAIAGYPHITVPAGYVHGLPVGLSFFAGAYQEPRLIAFAYAFEQANPARVPPTLPPSIEPR